MRFVRRFKQVRTMNTVFKDLREVRTGQADSCTYTMTTVSAAIDSYAITTRI